VEPRTGQVWFAGHRICYRLAGDGPTIVLVKPHRRSKDYLQLRLLSARFRVIQVEPLGFGDSDRPAEYPTAGLHEQVLSVLDCVGVDQFVIWGYSQGAAVAAAVAQATQRAAALVAGGFSLLDRPTDTQLSRMDRQQRVPIAPRAFWHWYRGFDWVSELAAMRCPRLVYAGADDRTYAPGLRRTRDQLTGHGVCVVFFEGLDHRTCNDEPALSSKVIPTVVGWLDESMALTRTRSGS
jgi:pimeloyl-ACP methyl ester carboxylesterase